MTAEDNAKRLPQIAAEIDRIMTNPTQEELEPLRVMLEKLWYGLNGSREPWPLSW